MEKELINDQGDNISFDLSLENELLLLKLKAEFGAECTTSTRDIPPVVVNEFLKSVYEFEQKFREPRTPVSIFDKIGKPFFRRAEELSPKLMGKELKRLMQLLHDHHLELDILGKYEDAVIYKFLTEEFFNHEMDDMDMPGYVYHFCYEEFHPNHEMDIRDRAIEFITRWFGRKLDEYSWELADQFVHPDSRMFTKEEVVKKIRNLFESYAAFSKGEYDLKTIHFKWDQNQETGTGYVEGIVRYDAELESREIIRLEGPFQFYLSNRGSWWNIFYFVFPGFSWNQ